MTSAPMMTNLPPSRGWTQAPCIAPGTTVIRRSARFVMIDHEADDGPLSNGDAKATERARRIIADVRSNTAAKVGWYGWPYPITRDNVARYAANFAPLLDLADVAFPCCYASGDGNAPARAEASRDALASAWDSERPIVAVVCAAYIHPTDVGGIKRLMCDGEALAEQVKAARVALADSIYVWSGIGYRTWLMRIWRESPNVCNDPSLPFYDTVRRGRDELLNLYGFTADDLEDHWSISEAEGRYAADLLATFWKLWKGIGK